MKSEGRAKGWPTGMYLALAPSIPLVFQGVVERGESFRGQEADGLAGGSSENGSSSTVR